MTLGFAFETLEDDRDLRNIIAFIMPYFKVQLCAIQEHLRIISYGEFLMVKRLLSRYCPYYINLICLMMYCRSRTDPVICQIILIPFKYCLFVGVAFLCTPLLPICCFKKNEKPVLIKYKSKNGVLHSERNA